MRERETLEREGGFDPLCIFCRERPVGPMDAMCDECLFREPFFVRLWRYFRESLRLPRASRPRAP